MTAHHPFWVTLGILPGRRKAARIETERARTYKKIVRGARSRNDASPVSIPLQRRSFHEQG
jgi:hypothetical protein